MSRHDDRVTARQMRDFAIEAQRLMHGKSRADLGSNRLLELAVTRLLELIGEAATRLDANNRNAFPQVPWADIIAMRNRLIHGYDSVDLDVVWQVVQADLPPLVTQLDRMIAFLGPSP